MSNIVNKNAYGVYDMKRKYKILISSIVLIGLVVISWYIWKTQVAIPKQPNEISKLGELAYEQYRTSNCIVYLKEKNDYIPFIVLTNNYNKSGNSLLLRKETLPAKKSFDDMYGYYNGSNIDEYLTKYYINNFATELKDKIIDTSIRITVEGAANTTKEETETIDRKIFLLAYSKVCNQDTALCGKEGKTLIYFTDKKQNLDAYSGGRLRDWWLRSSYCWDMNQAFFISGFRVISGDQVCYVHSVRPALCINSNTPVQKEILDGKEIYKIINND